MAGEDVSQDDGLVLRARDLLSPAGFEDGRPPVDLGARLAAAGAGVGVAQIRWSAALRELVRCHLLPAIDAPVEVREQRSSAHNPIRVVAIDGVLLDPGSGHGPDVSAVLERTEVVVPWPTVVAVCLRHLRSSGRP